MAIEGVPKRARDFVAAVAATYGEPLHRYLVRRLRSGDEADDLAQEVYLRLLRLNRTDLIRQPAAYVYFLASQVIGEHRMRAAKRPLVYDSDLLESAMDDPQSLSRDEFPNREHADRELRRLLSKLNAAHRAVWIMRKRDGFSVAEIAEKLGMSPFKVKRYLVEANSKLESAVAHHEGTP
jgi:RNA polymerase sigma-70 factor (ECF subfamily)